MFGGASGLGLKLLVFNRWRLLIAFAGMAMAIIIMFIELGLLLGILDSQALVASLVQGDLVIMNATRTNLHNYNEIDRIRLFQVGGLPDVDWVTPIYQGTMGLFNPRDKSIRRIVFLAFPPNDVPLAIGNLAEIEKILRVPNTILFDRLSRPIYTEIVPGKEIKLGGMWYRVGGFVSLGPDVVNDGTIVMSEGTWLSRYAGARPIMGVIHLKVGSVAKEARNRILAQMPNDVSVLTPDELRWREIEFTLWSAPIGILFGIGMLAGLAIGLSTCYQILFNEIADRIEQYATLKAMGFSDIFMFRVVLEQAVLLSWGGFVIAAAVAWVAYAYLAKKTALAMHLGIFPLALIFIFATGMSIVAGLLALRRVIAADPAELY
jgi:putative ABC transport system permease protein